ncbi:hypothetical protein EYC84_005974 [Monilinia fructicola]|uniref:Uncharacterized protein n=1 Tax=Monilinia fructicola TaxID=38448 RepID=A0A5M9K0T5_MONFR|nr:hypothetical protein EYC84_005974 [Monilinia fructicola]
MEWEWGNEEWRGRGMMNDEVVVEARIRIGDNEMRVEDIFAGVKRGECQIGKKKRHSTTDFLAVYSAWACIFIRGLEGYLVGHGIEREGM